MSAGLCSPDRLKTTIQASGKTLDAVASEVGMDPSSLRRLCREQPKRGWTCDTADRLAKALHVSVDFLVRGE